MSNPVFKLHSGFVPATQICAFTRRNALPIESGIMAILRARCATIESMGDGFDSLGPAEQGFAASRIAASTEILKAFGMIEQEGEYYVVPPTLARTAGNSPLTTREASPDAREAKPEAHNSEVANAR